MVIALFCLMVASARATLAGLLVWLAEPARSVAPHLDGAHFSFRGLSETGPLSVWAIAPPPNARSITARITRPTMACRMDVASRRMVQGQACESMPARWAASGPLAGSAPRYPMKGLLSRGSPENSPDGAARACEHRPGRPRGGGRSSCDRLPFLN